jgi:murein DD-endopeptidase MepM/ murein hydrolase activator NlpD
MRKGRTGLGNEGMIVYIPRSGKSSKVVKVTSPFLKISLVVYFLLAIIVCLSFSLVYFINQNKQVNAQLDALMEDYSTEMVALSSYVGNQAALLDTKLDEISEIETSQADLTLQIQDLSGQLKDLVDSYTKTITLASASVTAATVTQFADDAVEIADALQTLLTANKETESELVDFSDAADELSSYLDAIPSYWPTESKVISSEFGGRMHPIFGVWRNHTGVDIGGWTGDDIYAAASGTVISAYYESTGYGYCIRIRHSDRITTLYAHCSKLLVKAGDKVVKGQLIGYVGATGTATGPHLHFEIKVNDISIDPMLFIGMEE